MGTQRMILYTVTTLIIALVFFMLFSVQKRGSQAAVEATTYRAAKQDMLNLTQAIEQDFKNIGSYLYKDGSGNFVGETMDPGDVIKPGWYDSTAVAGGYRYWFQFYAQPDSLSPPRLIRYEWEPIDGETVTLNDGTIRKVYEVERLINYGSGFTRTGTSNTITEINFELLPDTTTGITTLINLSDTRAIRMSLAGVSRLGKGETVEETRFDAVYRPVPMAIKDNTSFN